MRRQNPPQTSLEQAESIEKYLNPQVIAASYAVFATFFFGFTAVLFGVLVHDYLLNPNAESITVFAVVGLLPSLYAFIVYSRRPNDPLSRSIARFADSRRQPIDVEADDRTFKVLLMSGEAICINFSFHYPAKRLTREIGERLDTYVHVALEQHCTMRDTVPTKREIEEASDCALELLAAQYDIPVLYSEVREVFKIRDSYSDHARDITPPNYHSTGTMG